MQVDPTAPEDISLSKRGNMHNIMDAYGAHPREVLRLGSGHEGVSGTLRDIVDEVACDGYLDRKSVV